MNMAAEEEQLLPGPGRVGLGWRGTRAGATWDGLGATWDGMGWGRPRSSGLVGPSSKQLDPGSESTVLNKKRFCL